MNTPLSEVTLIITLGTLLLLILAGFVAMLLVVYRRRYVAHQIELIRLREAHQREILTAQLETQNQILQHVADELHDHVGQMLSVVWLHLNMLHDASSGSPFQQQLEPLLSHTATLVADVRSLSKSLSNDTIARYGLPECIRLEIERIDRTRPDQRTHLCLLGEPYSLGEQNEIILLRMVQEAINNALKHAHNAAITVTLAYRPNALTLSIADDGPGFSLAEAAARPLDSGGQGLSNLRRRATLLGGTCDWETAPGAGTLVRLVIPKEGVASS